MQLTLETTFPVEPDALFAVCASRAGFVGHFPFPVRWHAGPSSWRNDDVIDFSFRMFGLWSRYVARITHFVPGKTFTDEMQTGIYRRCRHTHRFEAHPDGTRLVDIVDFTLGYGTAIDRTIGLPLLRRTFRDRHALLRRLLDRGAIPC